MKTIEAVAKLYRGIPILETMSGFVVILDNKQYDSPTRSEAQALVDAWIVANMKVAVFGNMPIQ